MTARNWDPEQFGDVYSYSSLSNALMSTKFPDGVHRIPLEGGGYQEILFRGNPLDSPDGPVLVFFPGAISDRENKVGPFFSGDTVSANLGRGYISVADPLIAGHQDLNIAWYTGQPGSSAQAVQTEFFNNLAKYAYHGFLIVGGSAGGFGAIRLAATLPSAQLFVWNPQTNFLNYSEPAVRRYLAAAGLEVDDSNWKADADAKLARAGVSFDLAKLARPSRGLVIQNFSDDHLRTHFIPYINAKDMPEVSPGYFGDDLFGGVVFDFGSGHAAPRRELQEVIIRFLLKPGTAAKDVYQALVSHRYIDLAKNYYPMDLRKSSNEIQNTVKVLLSRQGDKVAAGIDQNSLERWPSLIPMFRVDGPQGFIGYMQRDQDRNSFLNTTCRGKLKLSLSLVDPSGNLLTRFIRYLE